MHLWLQHLCQAERKRRPKCWKFAETLLATLAVIAVTLLAIAVTLLVTSLAKRAVS